MKSLDSPDVYRLHGQGWVELRGWPLDRPEQTLTTLARSLGEPVSSRSGGELLDCLRPMASPAARPSSLSRQHGAGAFPFHTDTAHWPVPARYLMLCCLDPGCGERGTLLMPISGLGLSGDHRAVLAAGVFLVRNGRHSWYSSVLTPGRPFVRYDAGCMSPATASGVEAARLMKERLVSSQPVRIRWEAGTVIVVDNWVVLHGREAALDDADRVLLRVLVRSAETRRPYDRL